jgi:hypothetical protein
MKISMGEFCRFGLQGKLELLCLFGEAMGSGRFEKKQFVLYRMADFNVAVIKEWANQKILSAEPVLSHAMLHFYYRHLK